MATAQDGTNPGRASQPQRQSPARKNSGRGANAEPTSPSNQTPADIFGARTALSGTGLPGSAGARSTSDVTQVNDQSLQSFTDRQESHGDTTLDGSQGARPGAGGESVTYTDPFAYPGGVLRDVTTHGDIDGDNDWTQGAGKYATGPALPGIEGNRPTDTGLGRGRIRGAGKGL